MVTNFVDSDNENYHAREVHPVLSSILDESDTVGLKGNYLRHQSDAKAGVESNEYPQHLTWWLGPNLCPMTIPGGGFRGLHIMRDGPERTKETHDFIETSYFDTSIATVTVATPRACLMPTGASSVTAMLSSDTIESNGSTR